MGHKKGDKSFFTKALLHWNKQKNKRQMPWKGEKDPYKIWLSEIILQQTRVEQGLEYYNRFILNFPTISSLAKAPETKVYKLWEGLGYYSRCKNMIATAKYITEKYDGIFPNTYNEILELKGIGPYTAAAIGSFAFNLPHAVVDGNVFRALSRYFGIKNPIDSTEGKKIFTHLANELLDKKLPGIYNQALMDFGAVICKPQIPLCTSCPLKVCCIAYFGDLVNQLPVKEKKFSKKTRWFYYLIIEHNGSVYLHKRAGKDIWENLYEFVLIENEKPFAPKQLLKQCKGLLGEAEFSIIGVSKSHKQILSHQIIHAQFIKVILDKKVELKEYKLVLKKSIKKLPFPKLIAVYLGLSEI